jgi:ParB family chromosome partitioning protein
MFPLRARPTANWRRGYASTENQEKQLLVWNSYGTSYSNADTIRRVIANETMNSTDPVAILVGEDRYADAGGKVDRDLFSDSGDKWVNPEIAQRLRNVAPVLPDELRPLVGAFLKLTPKGEMVLDAEYYSEEPIRIGGTEDETGDTPDKGSRSRPSGAGRESATPTSRLEAVAPGGKPLSARLYDELAMQRRDVLAATLLSHPALALDYALFVMIDDRMTAESAYGSTIRARSPQDPVTGEQPATRARSYLAEAHDGLDAGWTEYQSQVDRFEAFRGLDDDAKAAWLAYIVAMSLEAPNSRAEQSPLHNRLATIMEIDVASWWRPTSENFFDRVSKGSILTLLADVGGAALTARHATMKKSEISESCAKLFAGEAIVEPEVRDAALAWVPNAMKFLDSAPADDLDVDDEPEDQGGDQETVAVNDADGEPQLDDQDALAA